MSSKMTPASVRGLKGLRQRADEARRGPSRISTAGLEGRVLFESHFSPTLQRSDIPL
jgi:hypothetical protein